MKDYQADDKKLSRRIDSLDEDKLGATEQAVDADTVDGVHADELVPVSYGQAYNLEMGKYQVFNDYDDDPALNKGIRAYVRDGVWSLNKHTGETNKLHIKVDGDITAHQTSAIATSLSAYNSVGGIRLVTDASSISYLSQTSGTGSWEEHWTTFVRDGKVGLNYNNIEKLVTTSNGIAVTGVMNSAQVDTGSGLTGGILIEDGKHAINSNDGGGNFNIRVGNAFDTGMTEAGYGFHHMFDQAAGFHSFKTTSASQAVGETPVWNTVLTLYPSVIINKYAIRPETDQGTTLGTATYGYSAVYATDFIGKASNSDKLGGAIKDTLATVDTIVQRDGSGHIRGNYVFSSYLNMTHGAGIRNTDTVFYSSNDNYVRKNTQAGFRTSLDVYSKAETDAAAGGGGLESVQVFTASGTWTKPAGINKVIIEVTGGGGGGAGAANSEAGSAGGAAGYGKLLLDVSAISSETITVGAKGIGGALASAGTSGTSSSFGIHLTCTGGINGTYSTGKDAGGAGGTSSGGDINITGGNGQSSALDAGSGAASGGSNLLGNMGQSSRSLQPYDATGYGAGGAGGTGNEMLGSDGAPGVIIVWEYK